MSMFLLKTSGTLTHGARHVFRSILEELIKSFGDDPTCTFHLMWFPKGMFDTEPESFNKGWGEIAHYDGENTAEVRLGTKEETALIRFSNKKHDERGEMAIAVAKTLKSMLETLDFGDRNRVEEILGIAPPEPSSADVKDEVPS